jgi:XTP/dITP diphosphohydrolase
MNHSKSLVAIERLLNIMDDLREKCPWDQKQTIESLRNLTIEEVYELSEAIMDKDLNEVKNELGDLLLHIVFYAKIGSETNQFDLETVANSICEKLIVRHPHIYGDVKVSGEEEVKQNWEKIKLMEGRKSVLEGVPKGLPALIKAIRIQDKAKGVGFDWDNKEQVWEKVQEELQELQEEIKVNSVEKIEAEFGDVLFSLINYARFLNINPEEALEKTNKKFIQRFQYLENASSEIGKPLKDMTLDEMNKYWNDAKKID